MPLRSLRQQWRTARLMVRSPQRRNVLILYGEVIFAGVLSAAASFDSAYVLRLGGSNALIGLLTSVPALLAIFLYLPCARVLERKSNGMRWLVGSLLFSRLTYLLIFALPFLFSQRLPELTSTLLIAMTIPSVFFTTGWSPLLADVVPRQSLATVMSWRSILSSATIAMVVFGAGLWLDKGTFPSNYQWMYAVGFMGGIVSILLISRIKLTQADSTPPTPPTQGLPWRDALRGALQENQSFLKFIGASLFFNLGMWMVSPLYIIYFVRSLGAADSWVALRTTLSHVGVVVGYWLWRRILKRMGEHKALIIARPLLATYAFIVVLVPNLDVLLAVGFLINVVASGVGLCQSLIMLDLLPKEKRHTWMAIHSTIMNLGAFICPLVGVAVSGRWGMIPTFLIGGTLRMAGALILSGMTKKPKHHRIRAGSRLRPRPFGGSIRQ